MRSFPSLPFSLSFSLSVSEASPRNLVAERRSLNNMLHFLSIYRLGNHSPRHRRLREDHTQRGKRELDRGGVKEGKHSEEREEREEREEVLAMLTPRSEGSPNNFNTEEGERGKEEKNKTITNSSSKTSDIHHRIAFLREADNRPTVTAKLPPPPLLAASSSSVPTG